MAGALVVSRSEREVVRLSGQWGGGSPGVVDGLV
jgi:hypothetical protein